MSDPLADVIEREARVWGGKPPFNERVLIAVRTHLAAVLDAEEAAWVGGPLVASVGAQKAVDNLRSTLGLSEPVAGESGDAGRSSSDSGRGQ